MAKIWFKAKHFGWGWYPCTWQGWLVLLIWAILFTFSMIMLDHEWLKNTIFLVIMTAILIYICYKKGETPKWRFSLMSAKAKPQQRRQQ